MGVLREPYDAVLAVRLDEDFRPLFALEIPRDVLERHYPPASRTALTRSLENDPEVQRIAAETLLTEGAGSERAE